MSEGISKIFITEGKLEVVGGNQPFLLNDPNSVWLVEYGQLEVFSVRVEGDQPQGTRFHFCSISKGQLAFGMDSNNVGGGRGFLAVGMVNTRLYRLTVSRFRELAQANSFHESIVGFIDQWVAALSSGLAKDIHTRTDLALENDQPIEIPENKSFRSKKGVRWVNHEGADLALLGIEDISPGGKTRLFPITEQTWFQSFEPVKVTGLKTGAIVQEELVWASLEFFYETILKCESINKRLAEVDEFNRLQDRFNAGKAAADKSLKDLAAVFRKAPPPDAAVVDDPLYNACAKVASAQGILLTPPLELVRGGLLRDPLGAISKSSGARLRKVRLKGAWWTVESGPLLVFREEGMKPLAAVPLENGRYSIFDPATGEAWSITTAEASKLHSHGYTFYRSFGTQATTAWKVLCFGVHGLGKDFRRLLLMGLLGGLLCTLPAIATGILIDSVIPSARNLQLWQISAGLVLIAVSIGVFEFIRGISLLRIEGKMDKSVQAAVMDRLFRLPVPFFRKYSSGDLADRANGISQIRQTISLTVGNSILSNIFGIFNLVLLFYYSSKLALIALCLIIVTVGFTAICSALQVRYQRQVMEIQGRLSGQIVQFLDGITKLRVAGAEVLAFSKWAGQFAAQKRVAVKSRNITNRISIFNAAFPIISTAVLFSVVVYASDGPPMSPGSFLAFSAAFTIFLGSMLVMSLSLVTALNVVPLFERLRPILTEDPEISTAKVHPGELTGSIELSNVSFRYSVDGPLILKNISLAIRPGEFIAIVGPSGSGKSTLLRLLLGFDQPETGSILYDGQEFSKLDVNLVRRQIGTVLQSSKLMSGNILFNITGSLPLSQEDAWEAVRMAGLEEDIKQLPMGMQTVVSTGSPVFSGGQQQRLMIARAIAFKPKILLFDEATSALDNRTQAMVSASLEKLHATRIVIAHRLSTIINADRIYVVDAGSIVQAGTYNELVSQPGVFQELARRQLVESENLL